MRLPLILISAILFAAAPLGCGPLPAAPPFAVTATPPTTPTLPMTATPRPSATAMPRPSATTTGAPSASPSPTAPLVLKPRVLRIGRTVYPQVIDPQRAAPGNGLDLVRLTYEGLLTVDEKGNLAAGSAARWELAQDGMTLTFYLRDDLKRADGTPLSARDFEYALKRAADPRVPGRLVSYVLNDVKGADALARMDTATAKPEEIEKALANLGVKATDDQTLVVTFRRPVGYWEFVAATQVTFPTDKKRVDQNPENWWSQPEGHNGNGPFKIQTIAPGKKIVLVPNENYWRGKPKLERIEFIYYTDAPTALDAYQLDEIDLLANVTPDHMTLIAENATLQAELARYPAAITYALVFNHARKPFDDKNVRAAFSQAFDRENWVREVMRDLGKPYTRWIPPGIPGAQADKPGVPGYNPAAAVATLVNNGYAARDSTPANPRVDCAKLSEVRLAYPIGLMTQFARAQFLATNFARVFGCPFLVEPVEPAKYRALFQDVKTIPPISLRSWAQDYPHPHNWLSTYWACGAIASAHGFCDRTLDTLFARADRELDLTAALSAYRQAEDALLDTIPAAFASYGEHLHLVKPYVIGPKNYPSPSDWHWAGEYGPVWTYDIDLTRVPADYPER